MGVPHEPGSGGFEKILNMLLEVRSGLSAHPGGSLGTCETALEEVQLAMRRVQRLPAQDVRPHQAKLLEIQQILHEVGSLSQHAASYYGGWRERRNAITGGYDEAGRPHLESESIGSTFARG